MSEAVLDQVIQDPELQAKLAIKSLLENPAFVQYRKDLNEMCLGAQDSIVNLTKSSVDEKKLSDFNYKLGYRKGLHNALLVIESLESQLIDDNSPSKA